MREGRPLLPLTPLLNASAHWRCCQGTGLGYPRCCRMVEGEAHGCSKLVRNRWACLLDSNPEDTRALWEKPSVPELRGKLTPAVRNIPFEPAAYAATAGRSAGSSVAYSAACSASGARPLSCLGYYNTIMHCPGIPRN